MEDDARVLQGGSPFRMDHETPCHAQMHGQERRHRHSGRRGRGLQIQQGQLAPAADSADARPGQPLHGKAQGMQGALAQDVHPLDAAPQYLRPQGAHHGLHFRQFRHSHLIRKNLPAAGPETAVPEHFRQHGKRRRVPVPARTGKRKRTGGGESRTEAPCRRARSGQRPAPRARPGRPPPDRCPASLPAARCGYAPLPDRNLR